MMKNIFLLLILGLFSFNVFAQNYCGGNIKGGDGKPWPWDYETKYPLKSMQGVWQTVTGDCKNQFIFKITDSLSGKIVRILQYDPIACKAVGVGSGFLNDKIVVAQMNQKGVTYKMTIHVFNQADIESEVKMSSYIPEEGYDLLARGMQSKYVIVISLYPVGRWEQRTTYQIVKVDTSTNMICQ